LTEAKNSWTENFDFETKDRKTERQNDRKTERQKDRKTEWQKDRKKERQKDRKNENFNFESKQEKAAHGQPCFVREL
jgi:hypothetical protein